MATYKDYGFNDTLPTYVQGYIAKPVVDLLDKNKNKVLLDVGCGNGSLVKLLVENNFDAYGTDASPSGIKMASEFSKERYAIQDLSKDELPEQFINKPFDTIISTEVIEHLYDPRGFIKFCKNILVKNGGGEIIISTPYHGYLKNLIIALAGKWDQHTNPLWYGGHIKFWSRKTLSKLLEEEGFIVTDFVGCGRFPLLWKSMIIKAKI